MNTKNIFYCRNCNEIGVSAYTKDNWRTCYCVSCRSRATILGNGIHVGNKRLAAIGDLHGTLVIPEGVTEIYPDSLNNTSIKSIQFPRSLKKIPFECFKNCRNLEDITIPQTVEEIEGCAFEGCSALKKVTINGHTEVNTSAFERCSSLKELIINGSVQGGFGFSSPLEDCKCLEKITVNRGGNVGGLRFSAIPNLKKVSLLCSVKETNGTMFSKLPNFSDCKKLEEVELQDVEEIGSYTFSKCVQLKKVTLGKGTKRIASSAFYNCTSLESITIPNGCTEVAGFDNCTQLRNINIPNSVKQLGNYAFQNCKQFETFTIPEGVEELGHSAFEGCSNLKSINLPSTLRRIGNQAFKGCTSLEKIVLPDGLQEIGEKAFEQCNRIRTINLPASLRKIGNGAFQSLLIHLVIIPRGITELGTSPFEERWSKYSEQKRQYVVAQNAFVEGYLKENGLKYEVTSRKDGALLEAPIADGVLYYMKPKRGKVEIPTGVEIIESDAITEQETVTEIVISDSVREIKADAFAGCIKLEHVHFGSNIESIGSKSFSGLVNQLIELPKSIKEIAPDAFGEGCILSICGEMPFYEEKQAVLIKAQDAIKAKDALILGLQSRLQTLEEELESYIKTVSAEFSSIPQFQTQVFDIERRRAEQKRIFSEKQITLNTQVKQLEADIRDLSTQREKCFLLAISKKQELDARMQSKQQELQTLQTELQLLKEKSAAADDLFAAELNPVKRKLDELRASQRRWETGKESRMGTIYGIKRDLQQYNDEILKMKNAVDKETHSLEQEHKLWESSRDSLILRQKTEALLKEKASILANLILPVHEAIPCYTYKQRKAIVEEELLNKAFLEMIKDWDCERRTSAHNQYIETHRSDIQRVKEINALLGCAEDDGISMWKPMESHQGKDNHLPERFTKLNAWFAKTPQWKSFKKSVKEIACARSPKKNLYDKFFAGSDYFVITDGDEYLLVFPYCVVKHAANKPLVVLTYDKAQITVTYTERTDTGYMTPEGGELINMKFMYLNKDGSPSKRYKDNPLIRTYRFTHITISDGRDSFSFPISSHNTALQFETAFNSFRETFVNGEYCDLYKVILNANNPEDAESALINYAETKKRRAEAERIAAKAAEEAEKQRLEAERLAAQIAAEEKRKAIIQRQKELNEERKRQAEEKQKIYSLFEDDNTDVTTNQEVETAKPPVPLEVISKPLISNNVFKVQMKQVAEELAENAVCYFVTAPGIVISNKKKIANVGIGGEMTIGFVLVSGVDYTQFSSCLMRIESDGVVIGEIDFNMNISFYSDF